MGSLDLKEKFNMKEGIKRTFLYLTGLLVIGIGINISKAAQLGISPVSAVPYALELIWGIELGRASILVYLGLIILQILLLRKKYRIVQLLQVVCTYLLGIFITYTDTSHLLFFLPLPSSYYMKLIYIFISIAFIGLGVFLYLIPNLTPLPAEGLVKSIVEISDYRLKFSQVKVGVDTGLVLISALLSLIFLGKLVTVREGTIISALLVGQVLGLIDKYSRDPLLVWMEK